MRSLRPAHRGWRGALLAILLGAVAWLIVGPASLGLATVSCDETWASTSTSGAWSAAANWTPASVPTSSQNVCLPAGSYTVTLTGSQSAESVSVGAGVTLAVTISGSTGATLTLGSNGSSTNAGTIDLTDTDATGTGSPQAQLELSSGATLTNDGTILSSAGTAALGTNVINGQSATTLDNASDGTIEVNQNLQVDPSQNGLFETSGNVTIALGEKLLVDPSGASIGGDPAASSAEMDINGGTITIGTGAAFTQGVSTTGSVAGGAALAVSGGRINGGPLTVVSGASTNEAGTGAGASFSGSGSGTYDFIGSNSANASTLAGTIGSNQTVVLSASTADGSAPVDVNSNVTNDGTLELTDSDTSGTSTSAAVVQIASGDTLTNNGTIVSDPGPGGKGLRIIGQGANLGVLDNASGGTIAVNQNLQAFTGQDGTFTTTGTVNVVSGETFQLDPNGGGAGPSAIVNLNGGTVTNGGTLEIGINGGGGPAGGAAFNVNGGTVTGSDPIIAASATTTFSGTGSGSFTLEGGNSTLAGTIGSSDSVALSGTTGAAGSVDVTTSGAVVNDGTFTMTDPDTSASTSAFAGLVIPSSSSFTNDGTMISDPGPDGSGYRSIDGTLDNNGTLEVDMLLQLGLHSTSTLDNSGTVDIGASQALMNGGGSGSYIQSAGTTSLGGSGAALTAASVLIGGGEITGAGTICGTGGTQSAPCGSGSTGTQLTNGGTIAPSPTPATITVEGDYTQASTGTLAVGINSSGNDQLAVTGSGGTAALDGTLQVTTAGGTTQTTGETYQVLTAPSVSGTFASTSGIGAYTLGYNATSVTLTVATAAPAVSFNPTSLTFGSPSDTIAVGATSSQTLTITDSGHAALVIGALAVGGPQAADFSLSSDQCSGQTIQASASCTVSVSYTPTAAETDTAQLSVPDNAAGSPQAVSLTGHGGLPGARATVSPDPVDFGQVGVGVLTGETVTVNSTGTAPLTVSQLSLGGADARQFAVGTDTCSGQTIAAGGSCRIGLTLTATAAGALQATLQIADDAPGSPLSIPLTATASASGTLTGSVTTAAAGSTLPVSRATVDLCTYNATSDTNCRSTTTSGAGRYAFTGLAPGAYRMEAVPSQRSLQPGSAVVQIAAGPNTEDFTLTVPQPIPAGLSFNGQTSGTASSFWTSPDTITAPLDVPPSGTPGVTGVTVMSFGAAPTGGSDIQPSAYGELQVEYKFDSSGVPRLVAISALPGQAASFGSWSTSLVSTPAAGQDGRGLTVQGVFTPSQLALPGGEITTVAAAGGKTVVNSAPVHGEFDFTINHYSVFGHLSGDTASVRGHRSVAAGARGPHAVAHQGGDGSGGGNLAGQITNPSTNPSGQCTTSGPTYSGGGEFDLGGGYSWDSTGGGGSYSNPPDGPMEEQSILWGPNGQLVWQQTSDTGEISQVDLWTPQTGYNRDIVNSSGEAAAPDIIIARDGQSFTSTAPNDPNKGRYVFHSDGSITDQWSGITYGATGNVRSQGTPNPPPNCGPPPATPQATPTPSANKPASTTPNPNDPLGWAAWLKKLFGYEDPSGTVVTAKKIPVAAAKVVLQRSAKRKGPFKAVRKGSVVMSPSNRRNPDHTTAQGGFGWDVINGYYRITAQHAGCRAASGSGWVAHTRVLPVPPPVTGLRLALHCPHLTRTKSHTTLKAKKVPGGEVTLIATVHGHRSHHPSGLVEFTLRGRRLDYVPLEPRKYRAVLTVASKSTKGFRADYLGDGYNAPSSRTG